MQNRIEQIKRASWVAIIGNAVLAGAKIVLGLISGSLAVVGDGIDSTTDVVISLVTLFTAKIIAKPPDREHPYGHSRAETLATTILAFAIFFAGAQLFLSTVHKISEGQAAEIPSALAIYVTLFSIAGKLFLMNYQVKAGKKINSAMLIANGKNMQNDVLMSAGVLIGLIFTFVLNMEMVDRIVAILVSLWIIRGAVEIFHETNVELMDGSEDSSIYDQVFSAVKEVHQAAHPHRTRIRKLANNWVVALDVEVDGSLTVREAHKIAMQIEQKIKEKIVNVYDVRVHIEPKGNREQSEKYGLSSEDISSDKS